MVVVDLIKTFDIVNRKDFWKILQTFGCPQKLVSLVTSFHDGMKDCEREKEIPETSSKREME